MNLKEPSEVKTFQCEVSNCIDIQKSNCGKISSDH